MADDSKTDDLDGGSNPSIPTPTAGEARKSRKPKAAASRLRDSAVGYFEAVDNGSDSKSISSRSDREDINNDPSGSDPGQGEESENESSDTAQNKDGKSKETPNALQEEFNVMKQRLLELEGRLSEQKKFKDLQEKWDDAKKKYGGDKEEEVWQQVKEGVAQKLEEKKESYESNTRWIDTLRKELDRKLGDEEDFEAKIMTLRQRWERGQKRRDSRSRRRKAKEDEDDSDEFEWKQWRIRAEYERLRRELDFEEERLNMEHRRKRGTDSRYMRRRRSISPYPSYPSYPSYPPPPPPVRIRRRYVSRSRSRSTSRLPTRSRSRSRSRTRVRWRSRSDSDEVIIERPVFHPVSREIYSRPGETMMEWPAFKKSFSKDEIKATAIDVLVGDPFVHKSTVLSSREFFGRTPGAKSHTGRNVLPGQAPLPERIRINSTPLIEILEKIHGNELSSEGTRPITMIRPFKALVYYENKLRKWYNRLIEKYHVRTDISIENEVDAENKEPETIHNDDEEAQDSDAQSDQDIEENDDSENNEDEEFDDVTGSTSALEHLRTLLLFIDEKINAKRKYLRSPDCKNITFSDIWHLFKPGDFAMSRDGRQAYRIVSLTSTPHKEAATYQTFWSRIIKGRDDDEEEREEKICIHCVYIDFNGENLGPVTEEFKIKRFDGERPLKSLELHLLDKQTDQAVWDRLKERGLKFIEVAGVKHMYYDGYTLDTFDEINGQVMIDFEEAFLVKDHENWRPQVEAFVPPADPEENESCDGDCCLNHNVHADSYVERNRNEEFMTGLFSGISRPSVAVAPRPLLEALLDNIRDEELVIMSYRAFGFGLSSRTWAKLHLDYLDSVYDDGEADKKLNSQQAASREQRTAFDELVLPRGSMHKHIVKSLIAQHFKDKDKELATGESDQPDMVRGKGKGLILLLHGAPGVGKTTTAEGVAEFFKRPLFQITCGDLGTTAKDVETVLVRHFALAGKWGCILLLDEADVFLAQRDRMDFKRNGLVAVFLRILEYYTGVLFLTTNRLGDFDEAFASRIHISLYYPDLDQDSTRKVFELNLERIRKRRGDKVDIWQHEITEFINDYWDKHPDAHWNGRQIRNACQTALALAEFEAMGNRPASLVVESGVTAELKRSHFETVAAAYVEFMKYVDDIHGVDAAQRAWEQHLRVGRRSGRRGKGSVNPLLMPKESGTSSRYGTPDNRNVRPHQYPQQAAQQGAIPVQQQQAYQPQPQPGGVVNQPGGYGVNNAGAPGVAYPGGYYPPQGSTSGYTPAIHVEAPQQAPQGQQWRGTPPAGGAAAMNPQFGGGGAGVPGSMQITGGYINAGFPPQMGAPANVNMGAGGAPAVGEGNAAFYDQQQQQGQAGFPGVQGYPQGQMQSNPQAMNQQQVNPNQQMQQPQGQQGMSQPPPSQR
ncbi:uncharacterized protein F4822DRAFT_443486 [Hypoxylon trugodes]|uniref:uncharacterized protein n=1 Tax=Hypoxylon trugodes TaxID=326681 RepID=UPI00218F451C|nr:uncharacterized protein F4822DRAFT_443486 [Hypoxylon trugodes]KAI1388580.1 hypothetical protein F4822DRAFT_443486 [Hypoxylon trugodes]